MLNSYPLLSFSGGEHWWILVVDMKKKPFFMSIKFEPFELLLLVLLILFTWNLYVLFIYKVLNYMPALC